MSLTPLPAAHPCCPPTGHPSQDNCLKMQCIANAPALLPASESCTEIAVALNPEVVPAVPDPLPQGEPNTFFQPLPHELFLCHHQFRV
jgi:hypothetical protein